MDLPKKFLYHGSGFFEEVIINSEDEIKFRTYYHEDGKEIDLKSRVYTKNLKSMGWSSLKDYLKRLKELRFEEVTWAN